MVRKISKRQKRSLVLRLYEEEAQQVWAWQAIRLVNRERRLKRFPHGPRDKYFILEASLLIERYGATRRHKHRISETDVWSISKLLQHLLLTGQFDNEIAFAEKKVGVPVLPVQGK